MISDSTKIITRFGFPGLDGSLLEIDLHNKRHAVFLDTTAAPDPLVIFKQGKGFRRLNHERIPVNANSALRFHAQPSLLEFYDPKKGVENLVPVTVFLTDSNTGDTYELGSTPSKELCEKNNLPVNQSLRLAVDAFAWIAAANAMLGNRDVPVIHEIERRPALPFPDYWLHYSSNSFTGIWKFSFADGAVLLRYGDDGTERRPDAEEMVLKFPATMFRVSAIRVAVALDLSSQTHTKPTSVSGEHFVPVLLIMTPTNPSACNFPALTLGLTLTPSYVASVPSTMQDILGRKTYLDCVNLSGDALKWAEEFNIRSGQVAETKRSEPPVRPRAKPVPDVFQVRQLLRPILKSAFGGPDFKNILAGKHDMSRN